ncbi:MAG: hypothetical protein M3Q08_09675 [Pseudomonadota bacterium]|nr:hypothetical protein [Pseudomonadota bacterium]
MSMITQQDMRSARTTAPLRNKREARTGLAFLLLLVGCGEPEAAKPSAQAYDRFIGQLEANEAEANAAAIAQARSEEEERQAASEERLKQAE